MAGNQRMIHGMSHLYQLLQRGSRLSARDWGLIGLLAVTSVAIGSIGWWMVPIYLVWMVWLVGPMLRRSRNEASHPAQPEPASPAPGSEAATAATPPAGGEEPAIEPQAQPEPGARRRRKRVDGASPPRTGTRARRKPREAAAALVPTTRKVVRWEKVGPNKFIRIEEEIPIEPLSGPPQEADASPLVEPEAGGFAGEIPAEAEAGIDAIDPSDAGLLPEESAGGSAMEAGWATDAEEESNDGQAEFADQVENEGTLAAGEEGPALIRDAEEDAASAAADPPPYGSGGAEPEVAAQAQGVDCQEEEPPADGRSVAPLEDLEALEEHENGLEARPDGAGIEEECDVTPCDAEAIGEAARVVDTACAIEAGLLPPDSLDAGGAETAITREPEAVMEPESERAPSEWECGHTEDECAGENAVSAILDCDQEASEDFKETDSEAGSRWEEGGPLAIAHDAIPPGEAPDAFRSRTSEPMHDAAVQDTGENHHEAQGMEFDDEQESAAPTVQNGVIEVAESDLGGPSDGGCPSGTQPGAAGETLPPGPDLEAAEGDGWNQNVAGGEAGRERGRVSVASMPGPNGGVPGFREAEASELRVPPRLRGTSLQIRPNLMGGLGSRPGHQTLGYRAMMHGGHGMKPPMARLHRPIPGRQPGRGR